MPDGKRDYYEILEVGREATAEEVKRAYRKLAVQYHPDRNPDAPDAEERFKEATEAYKVLSDPEQRRIYDTYGHRGLEGAGFRGFADLDDIFSRFDIFGSVLGDLFGFGPRRTRGGPRPQRGSTVRTQVQLTFEEAFRGVEKPLSLSWPADCPECDGSGAGPGGLVTCPECSGTGQQVSRAAFLTMSTPCSRCGGAGRLVAKRCAGCGGGGKVRESRTLTVEIPPGVDSGDSMALRGQGAPGRHGGPPGDLMLVMEVEPDERFKREGRDLHAHVRVSFLQAVLGDRLRLEALDGPADLDIAPGTQPGASIVLRGRGMPDPNARRAGGGRGDLLVHLDVEIPEKLTREQRRALEALKPLFEGGSR